MLVVNKREPGQRHCLAVMVGCRSSGQQLLVEEVKRLLQLAETAVEIADGG